MIPVIALINDDELLQCMLNYPEIDVHEPFQLEYGYLTAAQQRDPLLISKLDQDSIHYTWFTVALKLRLVGHIHEPNSNPKICIPDALLDKYIQFYHIALAHTGMRRVIQTMSQHFWHPALKPRAEQYIHHCEVCQKNKQLGTCKNSFFGSLARNCC